MDTLKMIHESLRQQLITAQTKYKQSYDAHVKETPLFKMRDLIWLSRRNITTTHPTQKLDHKRLGPFRISEIVGESKAAFKLELSSRMKIHPIFHISLLTPYHANILPGRVQPPSSSIIIEGFEEFEVEEILDSRIHYNKLQYFVDWKDYQSDEWIWESTEFLKNAKDVITHFHTRYPHRSSLKDLPPRRRFALSLATILSLTATLSAADQLISHHVSRSTC